LLLLVAFDVVELVAHDHEWEGDSVVEIQLNAVVLHDPLAAEDQRQHGHAQRADQTQLKWAHRAHIVSHDLARNRGSHTLLHEHLRQDLPLLVVEVVCRKLLPNLIKQVALFLFGGFHEFAILIIFVVFF